MPIAANTIALYNFENNALDSSGNGYDLVTVGTLAYNTTPTPIPQGLMDVGVFSDSNYFDTPGGFKTALSGLAAGTIEGYVYFNSITNTPMICSWNDSTDNYFYVTAAGALGFTQQSVTNIESAPGLIITGGWYDVAATWDGSNLNIYINNTNVGSVSASYETQAMTAFLIGRFNLADGFSLDGYMDELRFSSVARTTFPTVDPAPGDGAALLDRRRRR